MNLIDCMYINTMGNSLIHIKIIYIHRTSHEQKKKITLYSYTITEKFKIMLNIPIKYNR